MANTTRWRLISGTLGVICLLLMATLGILFNTSHSKIDIEPTSSPGLNTELQEGSDCYSCPEKWVGYKCNCYFISSELKTWEESRNSCVSQNSSLLQLQNRDELQAFMHSSQYFYWTGLSYNEERRDWLWEDGSALSRNLFTLPETPHSKSCILYSPVSDTLDESCETKNRYICNKSLFK
uniref:Natural killer cells antigen CD94 n=1 Tax=Prolemur simus TaxID=1328070 RepID=A0A8C9DIS8_PROSS